MFQQAAFIFGREETGVRDRFRVSRHAGKPFHLEEKAAGHGDGPGATQERQGSPVVGYHFTALPGQLFDNPQGCFQLMLPLYAQYDGGGHARRVSLLESLPEFTLAPRQMGAVFVAQIEAVCARVAVLLQPVAQRFPGFCLQFHGAGRKLNVGQFAGFEKALPPLESSRIREMDGQLSHRSTPGSSRRSDFRKGEVLRRGVGLWTVRCRR